MISDRKRGAEFYDALVSRLQSGELPDDLRKELGVGSATMRRYEGIARARRGF